MQVNQSVWSQYPKDDTYYIDPLYIPYQSIPVETECGQCSINPWKHRGSPALVNPGLERRGWGWDFIRMHPDKDRQCPPGWVSDPDPSSGWCTVEKPEYEGTLYTDKSFTPKYQYWDSYAPRLKNPNERQTNRFDQRSVNPFTGNYVMYHNSKPNGLRSKYGWLPSKDSYLA